MTSSNVGTLQSRVAGAVADCPRHPRVEPPTVGLALGRLPARLPGLPVTAPISEALALLAEVGGTALLALDAEGRAAGLFAAPDLVRSLARRGASALVRTLGEAMTPCRHGARPADSVRDCLALMAEHRLSHLPVLDEADRPLALLAREDLLDLALAYDEKVFRAEALDQQILFLRGTYSC